MSEVKVVVVAESIDVSTGQADMIQCLGAFNNYAEAYGEGLMFLSELSDDDDDMITPLFELEGETGFGFSLKNKEGKETETVFVLHYENISEQRKGVAFHE